MTVRALLRMIRAHHPDATIKKRWESGRLVGFVARDGKIKYLVSADGEANAFLELFLGKRLSTSRLIVNEEEYARIYDLNVRRFCSKDGELPVEGRDDRFFT